MAATGHVDCLTCVHVYAWVPAVRTEQSVHSARAGVITNEDKLRKFFGQHILGPLAARAEPLPAGRGALPAGVEVSWLGAFLYMLAGIQ